MDSAFVFGTKGCGFESHLALVGKSALARRSRGAGELPPAAVSVV